MRAIGGIGGLLVIWVKCTLRWVEERVGLGDVSYGRDSLVGHLRLEAREVAMRIAFLETEYATTFAVR